MTANGFACKDVDVDVVDVENGFAFPASPFPVKELLPNKLAPKSTFGF